MKQIKIVPDCMVCQSFRIAARHASPGEKFTYNLRSPFNY